MCEVVFLMTCPPCVFNASLKDLLFSKTSSPVLAAAVNACLAVDFSKSVKNPFPFCGLECLRRLRRRGGELLSGEYICTHS